MRLNRNSPCTRGTIQGKKRAMRWGLWNKEIRTTHTDHAGTMPTTKGDGQKSPVALSKGAEGSNRKGRKTTNDTAGTHQRRTLPSASRNSRPADNTRKSSSRAWTKSHLNPSAESRFCTLRPNAAQIHAPMTTHSAATSKANDTAANGFLFVIGFQIVEVDDVQLQRTDSQSSGIHSRALAL